MPEDRLDIPRLARFQTADIAFEERADSAGKLRFPASSEAPVERYFGTEVLSHVKGAIRTERIDSGAAPLLFNHDWADPVGMLDGAHLEDGRLVVDAHLFDTARAREVAQMVKGGLRNVSIGYQLHVVEEQKKEQRFLATDWEPLEVSIVTVPADPSVGIGREAEHKYSVRILRAESPAAPAAQPGVHSMDQSTTAAAGSSADATVQNNGTETERLRIKGITALCRQHKVDEQTRDQWIDSGKTVDEAAQGVLDIIAARAERNPETVAKLDLTSKEVQRYSLLRAVNAALDKNWQKAGFEAETSRAIAQRLNKVPDANTFYVPFEVQQREVPIQRRDLPPHLQRDMTVATASAGGYLVDTQNLGFIELLRNRSVAFRMGVRRLSGLNGNVTVPKQSGSGTAYWLGTEATAITESNQTFTQVSLSPHTVGAYTEVSRLLTLQSSPDAEGIITSDLSKIVSIAADLAVLNGSGAAGQPLGIINTPSIGATTATSADYGKILDFQADVAGANVVPMSGGYVTTSAVAKILAAKSRFSNTDTPLWDGNLWDATMAGFRAMSSEQMPTGTMLFGDWSEVVVAEWGVLEIAVNPAANFAAGIIGIRAFYSMDVGVRYAGAFSYSSSVTA